MTFNKKLVDRLAEDGFIEFDTKNKTLVALTKKGLKEVNRILKEKEEMSFLLFLRFSDITQSRMEAIKQ